jgi:hypothetical protein
LLLLTTSCPAPTNALPHHHIINKVHLLLGIHYWQEDIIIIIIGLLPDAFITIVKAKTFTVVMDWWKNNASLGSTTYVVSRLQQLQH